MSQVGLREQKKAETREAISLAAVRLTAERGLDAVTVDDIAEAARVARRTFRNYFPNKEAAILHAVNVFVAQFVDLLKERDAKESLLSSLEGAAVSLVQSPTMVERMLRVRGITRSNQQLRVRWAASNANLDLGGLTDEIARRTKTNPEVDVYPRVVTQAAWGVITSALDMQSDVDDDRDQLAKRIRIGFKALGHGFAKRFTG